MTMIVANCSRATSCASPTLGNACAFGSTESLNQGKSTSSQVIMEGLNIKDMAAHSIFEGIGYLHHERKFCDVNIHVQGQLFCCHRVLLASVSKFFKSNMAPGNSNDYPLNVPVNDNNVTPQLFGSLLQVLHTGKDPVTMESVKNYFKMSAYLQIDFLTKYCELFLMENLTAYIAIDFWKFAQAYKFENVAKICYTWAAENIDALPQDELLALPKSMLLILLSLQKKLSMYDLCKTILSWVETDPDTRQTYMEELLPFVCFPHLSPPYLSDLSENLLYQLNNVLSGFVKQGIKYYMKGMHGNDANLQMEILAQQTVKLQLPDIAACCVVVGAQTEVDHSHQGVFTISSTETYHPLAPVPKNTGLHFASCTWQNAIYLSGGNTQPTFFAVYRPEYNQWDELPDIPGNGRAKHVMVAVNSCIYVIGGMLNKSIFLYRKQTSLVHKYDLKSSTWHEFCWLPKDVNRATAAVLGHRIYLIGGSDCDLVQCVDTRSGCAYKAGRLPYQPCTSRALSNGGIIYVVCSSGNILQMWEKFDLAEKKEESLAVQKDKKLCQELHETVSFVHVRKEVVRHFLEEHYFSACLLDGIIMLVRGRTEQGQLHSTIKSIDLETGDLACEPTVLEGLVASDLHVLNVPRVHLTRVPDENQETSSQSSNSIFPSPPAVLNPDTARVSM